MRCTHCRECCKNTMMELTNADIARLEKKGYSRNDFSYIGVDKIPRLKNEGIWCYFYDPEKSRCREYQARPLGCALYPVNLDEDGKYVLDGLCPQAGTITRQELKIKGKRLEALIATIDAEAAGRH